MKKKTIIITLLVLTFGGSVAVYATDGSIIGGEAGTRSGSAYGNAAVPPSASVKTGAPAGPLLTPPLGNGTAGGSDLQTIFYGVLDVVQTIMIMITTLYLIFAGFMFVTAKGNPEKLKKAKGALLWGLVGAALILCAEVLAHGIGDTATEVFKGQ